MVVNYVQFSIGEQGGIPKTVLLIRGVGLHMVAFFTIFCKNVLKCIQHKYRDFEGSPRPDSLSEIVSSSVYGV